MRYRAWRLASLTLAEKQAKELRRSGQSGINQACRQRCGSQELWPEACARFSSSGGPVRDSTDVGLSALFHVCHAPPHACVNPRPRPRPSLSSAALTLSTSFKPDGILSRRHVERRLPWRISSFDIAGFGIICAFYFHERRIL